MRVASIGSEVFKSRWTSWEIGGTKSMEQHQGLVINSLKTSKDLIGSDFPQRCEAWRPDVGFVVAPLPAVEVYPSHPSTLFRFGAMKYERPQNKHSSPSIALELFQIDHQIDSRHSFFQLRCHSLEAMKYKHIPYGPDARWSMRWSMHRRFFFDTFSPDVLGTEAQGFGRHFGS